MRQRVRHAIVLATIVSVTGTTVSSAVAQTAEWSVYAADKAGTKYLPLDQINRDNVADLEIAWRQPLIPDEIRNLSLIHI